MTYVITIMDPLGKPVAAAYATFMFQGVQAQQYATGADGTFSLDTVTDAGLFVPGVVMTVTAPGLPAYSVPVTSITGNATITLGGPQTNKGTIIGIGVIALGTYLILHHNKKTISGPGSADYSKYILPAGLLLGGVFIYNKLFGAGAGTQASAQNQQQIQNADVAANTQTLNQVLATGQQPTLSASDIASMANSIFSYGQQGNPVPDSAQQAIHDIVINVNNSADWYSLIQSFGTKSVSSASWLTAALSIPGSAVDTHIDDLPTYLRGVLNQSYKDSINIYFSLEGINYQL